MSGLRGCCWDMGRWVGGVGGMGDHEEASGGWGWAAVSVVRDCIWFWKGCDYLVWLIVRSGADGLGVAGLFGCDRFYAQGGACHLGG